MLEPLLLLASELKASDIHLSAGMPPMLGNNGAMQALNQPILGSAGASKLTPVAVKTPSHTRFLKAASEAFTKTLELYSQGNLIFPVVSAVSGKTPYSCKEAATALATQISSMLHWDDALETVVELRPDAVLEIGPGNALFKMLGDYAPSIPVRSVCDFKSVQGVITWLGKFS